ncbi:MAG: hypothetical protein ABIR54_07330 [Burkholderiaceae bacterium]
MQKISDFMTRNVQRVSLASSADGAKRQPGLVAALRRRLCGPSMPDQAAN